MKKRDVVCNLVAPALAVALLSAAPRSLLAQGPPAVPNLIGHWNGLLAGESAPDTPLPVVFDLTTQHERLVEGTSTIGSDTNAVHISLPDHGASRYFHGRLITAQDFRAEQDYHVAGKRVHITIDGSVHDLGGGTLGMEAAYTIGPPDNPTGEGTFISVQCIGGENWQFPSPASPSITFTDCWNGKWGPDTLWADFKTQTGSAVTGVLQYGFDESTRAVVATIDGSGTISGVIDNHGTYATWMGFDGQLQGDGSITGTLAWDFPDGSQDVRAFVLAPCCPNCEHGP